MRLYDFSHSSAAYRLRIALNLKGIPYEAIPVDLRTGEDRGAAYRARNPQGLVPALEDNGRLFTQSIALCEYLEETHPEPPLLPKDPAGRARVRALAAIVACDIHPLDTIRVLDQLTERFGADEAGRLGWYCHWIAEGLSAFERLLADSPDTGEFCHGDQPTLADVFLVPQVYNARRFRCDLTPYPETLRVTARCHALSPFQTAHPDSD